jgi:hypothetical protein
MTESKDRDVVREYFLSMLGHDIEIEKHFAQVNAWKKAPFDVYFVDQRAGDFIIIPPLAAHQVWNRGTRTMKVAWNRTTPDTLRLAMNEALPKAKLVCRDEQYKNKAILYFTLEKYYHLLETMERRDDSTQNSFMGIGKRIVRNSPRVRQLAGDFKSLFSLFTEVLVDEAFAYQEKQVEYLAFDSCVTCSYCRCNIFNRFLTCRHCTRTLTDGDEDAYDICMECYAMGRSCACLSGLQWCEQWSWSKLSDKYELWREMVIANDAYVDLLNSPPPFEIARQTWGKKSVAQICQEALIRRPWKDISKQDYGNALSDSDQEEIEDAPKKKPKRKRKQGEVRRCHVCCHKDYNYRVHECSNPDCVEAYCYGVLYRAFDLTPQMVMQDENWQCPKCLGICNCGHCRRAGNTNPYTPKNTSLGHDTRPIADDRSIEALVDFRVHNLSWLKAAGEESRSKDSRRMQRLRQQADRAKAGTALDRTEQESAFLGNGDSYNSTNLSPDSRESETEDVNASDTLALEDVNIPQVSGETQATSHVAEQFVEQDDISAYPDPGMASTYGIGMGYYVQDNSPDKILFNPYIAPPVGTIHLADFELPDSVKKSIRAAKRKAKRENEDPDFVVGRAGYKRVRSSNDAEMLDNMDPALFNTESSTESSTLRQRGQPPNTTLSPPLELRPGSSKTLLAESPAIASSNEPALRHARPLGSYVEVDDFDVDEVESGGLVVEESGNATPKTDSTPKITEKQQMIEDTKTRDDLQLGGLEPEFSITSRQFKHARGGKRRGRPPKQPLQSGPKLQEPRTMTTGTASSSTPAVVQRRRGRPRKAIARSVGQADTSTTSAEAALQAHDEPSSDAPIISGARLDNDQQPESDSPHGSTSGRSDTEIVGHEVTRAERNRERGVLQDADTKLMKTRSSHKGVESGPETNLISQPRKSTPVNQSFLSMAERLALRGKKFKMGKRKFASSLSLNDNDTEEDASEASKTSIRNPRRIASPASHRSERNLSGQSRGDRSPRTSVMTESPPSNLSDNDHVPTRATIVRLPDVMSSGDEYECINVQADASSDESGDSDIPSNRKDVEPRASSRVLGKDTVGGRGRGTASGRGRPRGRPKGRGRGNHL